MPKTEAIRPLEYRPLSKPKKALVVMSSFVGAMAPIVLSKKANLKNLKLSEILKVETNLKSIVKNLAGATLGGAVSGIILDKKEFRNEKLQEATFQILNGTLVATIVSEIMEKLKNKKLPTKILGFVGGLYGGLFLANSLINFLSKTFKLNEEKRHVKALDATVHIDDIITNLSLTKIPLINKISLSSLLPFVFTTVGYEVGTARPEKFDVQS